MLLGGVLTQGLGWPAIFLVNVPVGVAVIAVAPRLVPEGRAALEHRHFDVLGAVLVTGGFGRAVYGIVRTETLGWGSGGVLVPLALGVRPARRVRARRGPRRQGAVDAARGSSACAACAPPT